MVGVRTIWPFSTSLAASISSRPIRLAWACAATVMDNHLAKRGTPKRPTAGEASLQAVLSARHGCRVLADRLRRRAEAEGLARDPLMARSGVSGAAALLVAAAFAWPASACEGTDIVFEDTFADDAGGWAINQDVEIKDGSFTFKLPPDAMQSDLNVTYT